MVKFIFLIDKETSFAYWAQSLVEWGWYFESSVNDYFRHEAGEFSLKENEALLNLEQLLRKEGNQFHFLWQLYAGQSIENKDEKEQYDSIRKILNEKFERIWQKEYSNLVRWQEFLENYNFRVFKEDLFKIAKFLRYSELDNEKETLVKILLSKGNAKLPSAHVQPSFAGLTILNISSVPLVESERAIGTLIHELVHLFDYKANYLEKLAKTSYEKLIASKKLELKGDYKWKHLFLESVITSVASQRFNNYIGKKLKYSQAQMDLDNDLTTKKPLSDQSYGFLIRLVASNLSGLTSDYINSGKTIDREFMNKLAETWLEVLS